jgi:hypothetical protein
MNDEFERIWKKAVWPNRGTVLRYYLPSMMEENHENLSQDCRYCSQDSNRGLPTYKSKVLPLDQPCSVVMYMN